MHGSDGPVPGATTSGARSVSIDVFRGLAIFGMMFADVIPWDGLPRWMYHGQEPPPSHNYNPNVSGITWVDLVFPFFLFSMGVSIPLALNKRLGRRDGMYSALVGASWRFALLVAFAILDENFRPYSLASEPDRRVWLIGILGFLLVLPTYARLPQKWPRWTKFAIRALGWVEIVLAASVLTFPNREMPGFDIHRSDPIILVLATSSLFGTLAWLATRKQPMARLWIMAAILVFRLSALEPGSWAQQIWDYEGPAQWFFLPSYLGYLLVLLPGTFVGDLLLQPEPVLAPKEPWPDLAIGLVAFSTIPACLYALLERFDSIWLIPLAANVCWVGSMSRHPLVRRLMAWGAALLALGLILEPLQGGIKKYHPTLSYVTVTPGLAMLLLAAIVLIEQYRPKSFTLRFVAKTGANPLLAYVAITNLVAPLWALTVSHWITENTPGVWLGLGRAVLETVVLGLVVNTFTRYKIVMRA